VSKARRPFEEYLEEYIKYLQEVVNESYDHSREGTGMLFEFIDNWIDLIPKEKTLFLEAANSLSGILLLNSWKLTNWISFEILCGKYFEALRDLRFVFEGSVYGVVIEDLIESKVWRKWRSLSSINLKAEIFKLWETCKSKEVYDKKEKRVKRDKVEEIVKKFIRDSGFSLQEKAEHIAVYVEILSQPELYMPMRLMIKKCCRLLGIEEEQDLKNLWHELSHYQHFSYPYLEVVCEKPEFVFLEVFDKNAFEISLELYFRTMDLLYAVIAWRFPQLRKKVEEMNAWWKKNFNKSFALAEKVLERLKGD
jgi:hypothetical protein